MTLWCGFQFKQDLSDQISSHLNQLYIANIANATQYTIEATKGSHPFGHEVPNSRPEVKYLEFNAENSKPDIDKLGPEVNKEQSGSRVVLMTSFRGGSSFIGGLFLANPEAFYMFEPLRVCNFTYLGAISERVHNLVKQSCIRNLLDCNIRTFYDDLEYIEPKQAKLRQDWIKKIFGKPMRDSGVSAMDPKMNEICRTRFVELEILFFLLIR